MSSGWSSPPTAFVDESLARLKRVHDACLQEVGTSMNTGSDITGARGQPMDEDILRHSFHHEPVRDWVDEISSDKAYAESIEDAINYGLIAQGYFPDGPMQKRNLHGDIGQFHNREATIQGWSKTVEHFNETVP